MGLLLQVACMLMVVVGTNILSVQSAEDESLDYNQIFFAPSKLRKELLESKLPVQVTEKSGKTEKGFPPFFLKLFSYVENILSHEYDFAYRFRDTSDRILYNREFSDGSGFAKGYIGFMPPDGKQKYFGYSIQVREFEGPPSDSFFRMSSFPQQPPQATPQEIPSEQSDSSEEGDESTQAPDGPPSDPGFNMRAMDEEESQEWSETMGLNEQQEREKPMMVSHYRPPVKVIESHMGRDGKEVTRISYMPSDYADDPSYSPHQRSFEEEDGEQPLYITHTKPAIQVSYHSNPGYTG